MHLWELSKSGRSTRNELSSKRSLKINLRGSFLFYDPFDYRSILEKSRTRRVFARACVSVHSRLLSRIVRLLVISGTRLQLGISDLYSCALLYTDTCYRGYRRNRAVGGGRGLGSNLKIKKVTRWVPCTARCIKKQLAACTMYVQRTTEVIAIVSWKRINKRVIISKGLES